LKEKFGVELTGCIKTTHAGFPIEAMRWTLQSLERGQSCVFKLENEDVWAVDWSNVHYKLTLRRMAALVTATLLRRKGKG
jgi:hypothetical protein